MSVPDVVALLGELRAAEGRIAKARVLGRGLVILRDLSPAERRQVALAIAEQAAPELTPQIRERTGLELDAATLTEIVDLARDLDDEDLEEVIGRLLDPEQRWDAVEDLVEDALVPDEATAEHDTQPPPPPATAEPHAIGPPPTGPGPLAPTATEDVQLEEPSLPQPAPEPAEEPPPLPQAPVDAQPDPVAELPPVEEPAPEAAPPPSARDAPPPAPPEQETVPFADVGRPPETTKGDVIGRVRVAGTSLAKLRVVASAGESIYDLGPDGRLELVRALPDGWVRRRAVHRMLEFDVIAASDCLPIIRTFARATDRNWVAGSMIEQGLILPGDVAGLVSDAAVGRLERRLEGG
ncbi:MAG: hypothetical protein R3320_01465 [Nitriliruptorales bacterium]|nr:hypothetical protein [Nitriliruptorales bacterium]